MTVAIGCPLQSINQSIYAYRTYRHYTGIKGIATLHNQGNTEKCLQLHESTVYKINGQFIHNQTMLCLSCFNGG